jgi:tyrosyl-tRNA synthetase
VLARLGLASSVAEAARLVASGAVAIDGERVGDARAEIDLSRPSDYLLKVGKRRFLRLQVRDPRP